MLKCQFLYDLQKPSCFLTGESLALARMSLIGTLKNTFYCSCFGVSKPCIRGMAAFKLEMPE